MNHAKYLDVIVGITGFLDFWSFGLIVGKYVGDRPGPADRYTLDGNILSILRNVRHHREVARVNVPPTRLTELGLDLTEGRLQVARPAE